MPAATTCDACAAGSSDSLRARAWHGAGYPPRYGVADEIPELLPFSSLRRPRSSARCRRARSAHRLRAGFRVSRHTRSLRAGFRVSRHTRSLRAHRTSHRRGPWGVAPAQGDLLVKRQLFERQQPSRGRERTLRSHVQWRRSSRLLLVALALVFSGASSAKDASR